MFLLSFTYGNCDVQCPISDVIVSVVNASLGKSKPPTYLLTLTLDPERDDVAVIRSKHDRRASLLDVVDRRHATSILYFAPSAPPRAPWRSTMRCSLSATARRAG